jgi:hypothetical protein
MPCQVLAALVLLGVPEVPEDLQVLVLQVLQVLLLVPLTLEDPGLRSDLVVPVNLRYPVYQLTLEVLEVQYHQYLL